MEQASNTCHVSEHCGLDNSSLQCIFKCLSANYLVLGIKPINKHFRAWVDQHLGSRSKTIFPAAEVPSWSVPVEL
jgi:hypothetical protein